MGGGITLRKKTRPTQDELIWHLVLLRKVTSTACSYKVLRIIGAALRYWNDVVYGCRVHATPVTLSTIT